MPNKSSHNLEKLKKGFMFWNKYREKRVDTEQKISFSNILIEGKNWRFNELKGALLNHCDFSYSQFRDIDLRDIDFSFTDFSNVRFKNVHFTTCIFNKTLLNNCSFEDCSWYHSKFDEIDFKNLEYSKIHFFKCSFKNSPFDEGKDSSKIVFENCEFIN